MGEKPLTSVKDFSVIAECNVIERISIPFSRYSNSTVFHNLASAQNDNSHVSVTVNPSAVTLSETKSLKQSTFISQCELQPTCSRNSKPSTSVEGS
jgi:hypothetical protein